MNKAQEVIRRRKIAQEVYESEKVKGLEKAQKANERQEAKIGKERIC